MKTVNALTVRQSFGKILRELERTGEPLLLEKGRVPKAVLITLKDFHERFVDREAAEERKKLIARILSFKHKSTKSSENSVKLLRELRGPLR